MEKIAQILVIDDDPDIGKMLQMLLEYKGYGVTLIQVPQEAKEIPYNSKIDLIIMDMLLSGTNGVDLCEGFKKDIRLSHIPILMMSAHPDAKKACMEAGADGFIAKPFDLNDILLKINHLLTKSPAF